MNQTHQISPKITIKPLEATDAQDMFKLIDSQREYLGEWLPFVKHTCDVSYSLNYINSLYGINGNMLEYTFKILIKGKFVGTIGFTGTNKVNSKSEIGYWLSEKYQGQGIITSTVKYLLDLAFTELKLNRIQIKCAVGNTKSINIPKRLNFTFEGIERAGELFPDGTYKDIEIYSILKGENIDTI